ncbi:MAG: methyltransferase [Asticcacaulis sp.]
MKANVRLGAVLAAASLLALGTAVSAHAQTAPECAAGASVDARLAAALAKPDRPDKLKANDPVRESENRFLLDYAKPGMHVLDLGAGGGYSTWLLSSAVCSGDVDSQNPPQWAGKSPEAQAARDAMTKARPNIHPLIAEFSKIPVPAKPYDLIFSGTIYHDTYNMPGADAVAMDKALFNALKPGGLAVIIDHNAVAGAGASTTNTLHRIDKAQVIKDFKAAGFELVKDSDALANAADDRTLMVFDPKVRGHTDRMALVFKRP